MIGFRLFREQPHPPRRRKKIRRRYKRVTSLSSGWQRRVLFAVEDNVVRSCTQVARGKRADAVIVALPATIVIDVTIIFHSVLMEIYIYIYVSIAFLYNNFSGIIFDEFEFSCSRIKKIERDSFLCDVCYATKLSDDRRRDLISIFPHWNQSNLPN